MNEAVTSKARKTLISDKTVGITLDPLEAEANSGSTADNSLVLK